MPRSSPNKIIEVAMAVIQHDGQLLICQRHSDAPLGGLWEFPGGKIEAGESPQACLLREVKEELDLTITIIRALPLIDHEYDHARIRLHPFLCKWIEGQPKPLASAQFKWISPDQLTMYQFPPANQPLIAQLISTPPTPASDK